MAYYRNVYDHLVRVVDMTESYRDVISGVAFKAYQMYSKGLNIG